MRIVNLIAGIILFTGGLFLGIVNMVTLSKLKTDFTNSRGILIFAGSAIAFLGVGIVSFFMMKYGLRLTKKKS